MYCKYCHFFIEATRRLNPKKEDDDGPKIIKRLCDSEKKWVKGDDESCDSFSVGARFYCDRLACWQTVDTCKAKKASKLKRQCKHCPQHYEIVEVMRMRSCPAPKVDTPKPALLRRRTNVE